MKRMKEGGFAFHTQSVPLSLIPKLFIVHYKERGLLDYIFLTVPLGNNITSLL